MIFTEHALDRCKERLGWSKATAIRMLPAIVAEGITRDQVKGSLRRFLDKGCIVHHKGAGLRIFGRHIFIIEKGIVVAVLELPKRWHRTVDAVSVPSVSSVVQS
jgi:hypothetical protein